MMTETIIQNTDLENAVNRFADVLALPLTSNGVVCDSAIRRFKICVDLSWKTLKTILQEKHGIECASPKGCIREAFSVGIITQDDPFWLTMIELRNLSAHTYNEETAVLLYNQLPAALTRFQKLLKNLD